MTYDIHAPRAPRLKENKVTKRLLLGLTKADERALDALLAKVNDATVSRSTLIRRAIKAYAEQALSLRGSALARELRAANEGTYADGGAV